MYFLGIEHGTRAVRGAFVPQGSKIGALVEEPAHFFEVARRAGGRAFPSIIERIREFSPLSDIGLTALTYSMGDGFTQITDIRKLKNRGIRSIEGAGAVVGLGTAVFDELRESEMRIIVLPGIHRDTPTVLPEFRVLYSHIAAPDKVGSAYHASLFLKHRGMPGKNFILSDAGANTVTLLIRDGRIAGGVDAALGAPGLLQGPLDLEAIRKIDSSGKKANEMFSMGGLFSGLAADETISHPEFQQRYRALASAIAMETMGLMTFLPHPEAIVVTGSAPYLDFEMFSAVVRERLRGVNVLFLNGMSAALGCAEIARDVHLGKREILGIKADV